jgi:predicted DNA-binding protein (UPF0251 family)
MLDALVKISVSRSCRRHLKTDPVSDLKVDPLRSSLAQAEPGRTRVLDVENWAEIRRLHRAEGMPITEIARVMGVSRNTVRAAIARAGAPRYERPRTGSVVDAEEPRIRELLRAYPRVPATVIAVPGSV